MSSLSVSDRDFTERLIEEVQRHPVLYDPNVPGYKDRFRVEDEWQAVALCMNCSANSAKNRWQNLRGSFSRSMGIQKHPAGPDEPVKKKRRFYLAEQMSFLLPHMYQGKLGSSDNEPLWEDSAQGSGSQDDLEERATPRASPCPSSGDEEVDTITPTSSVSVQRKREAAPDTDDFYKEKVARFLDARRESRVIEKSHNIYRNDLESLRGLVPHMAILSSRRKRTFLRKVYNLLFEIVEEQEKEEDNLAAIVYI